MRNVKKQHLPSKICPICQRPFSWRKKWEKDWEKVRFCSDRCKKSKILKTEINDEKYFNCRSGERNRS
ncbi:MAG: DUF2256 domain-containing protein [Kaistella sp.]|nr:DUF2256 domain-containing protein [Kaistella sp.]